jgi:hypothetical protein
MEVHWAQLLAVIIHSPPPLLALFLRSACSEHQHLQLEVWIYLFLTPTCRFCLMRVEAPLPGALMS